MKNYNIIKIIVLIIFAAITIMSCKEDNSTDPLSQYSPRITSVYSNDYKIGSLITLQGDLFGKNKGTVLANNQKAEIVLWNETNIVFILPYCEKICICQVISSDGLESNLYKFELYPEPYIPKISPRYCFLSPFDTLELMVANLSNRIVKSISICNYNNYNEKLEILSVKDQKYSIIIPDLYINNYQGYELFFFKIMIDNDWIISNNLKIFPKPLLIPVGKLSGDKIISAMNNSIDIKVSGDNTCDFDLYLEDRIISENNIRKIQLNSDITKVTFTPDTSMRSGNLKAVFSGGKSTNSIHLEIINVKIDNIFPNNQAPGKQVTITGQNFGEVQGNGFVVLVNRFYPLYNDTIKNVINWSDNKIELIIPEGSISGNFRVITNDQFFSNYYNYNVNLNYQPDYETLKTLKFAYIQNKFPSFTFQNPSILSFDDYKAESVAKTEIQIKLSFNPVTLDIENLEVRAEDFTAFYGGTSIKFKLKHLRLISASEDEYLYQTDTNSIIDSFESEAAENSISYLLPIKIILKNSKVQR